MKNTILTPKIAPAITKAASKQTYYTIRFLVDHDRVEHAYRAYAYFRWVDDTLDAGSSSSVERSAFIDRQKFLLEKCYRGEFPEDVSVEEKMLVDLIQHDPQQNNALPHALSGSQDSGLQAYLRNMMQVMDFDASRRGRLISQAELNEYTHWLASAVTEALHYFIGYCCAAPHDETRYRAVSAAHITHMLRDTFDDVRAGYYNIPREVLEANHIGPDDIHSKAYRGWVQQRVALARRYFEAGKDYFTARSEPALSPGRSCLYSTF